MCYNYVFNRQMRLTVVYYNTKTVKAVFVSDGCRGVLFKSCGLSIDEN